MTRQRWLVTGLLIFILALVAACGDDDEDEDTGLDAVDGTATVAVEGTDQDAGAGGTESGMTESTATSDTGMATGTEAEAMTTGTEDEAGVTGTEEEDATMEADGTSTEDADATGTEEGTAIGGTETDEDGTATEDEEGTATGDAADATGTESDGTPAEGDGDTAELGEPIEVGDVVLTVEEVATLESTAMGDLGGILGVEEGNQFLGVSMMVENAGDDPLSLTEVLGQMRLETEDGEEYSVDLAATALALLSGDFENISQISSGEEVPITVGFQVPEDLQAEDLTLVVEPQDGTGDPVRVPLGEGSS